MDMMLDRRKGEYGLALATREADQMVYTDPRAASHGQRLSRRARPDMAPGKLGLALQIMENNLEDPLRPDEIAQLIGPCPTSQKAIGAPLGSAPARKSAAPALSGRKRPDCDAARASVSKPKRDK